jgi:hypothetical protein
VKGKTPGKRFENALRSIVSIAPERAAEIRAYTPKKRSAKPVKAGAH